MITKINKNRIFKTSVFFALIFTMWCTGLSTSIKAANVVSSSQTYASELFNIDKIITLDIKVNDSDWKTMLANADKEEYISCDVTINGKTFYSVGIRPKGNSSLAMVTQSGSSRYSFKLEFDHFIDGQTCFGLDKLVLNNIMADSSYMKEYLSYEIMNFMNVPTPLHNYARININGAKWGLYLAVEAVEAAFLERNALSTCGQLYSVKSMLAGGAGKTGKTTGGNLVYNSDSFDNYSAIFNNAIFKPTDKEKTRIVEAIKNLSENTNLESSFDIDEILRYFAAQNFVVNLDSYFSNMQQNYILYESEGILQVIPWDYNLAFGGFQSGTSSSVVNFPIDTPYSGVEASSCPLFSVLMENEQLKEQYHQNLNNIVENYFESGVYESTIDKINTLIQEEVETDVSPFYTYADYTTALPVLKQLGVLRAQSVSGQIKGTIPSTTADQKANESSLIDSSSINLALLGSQGGGGDKAGGLNAGFPGDFGGGNGQDFIAGINPGMNPGMGRPDVTDNQEDMGQVARPSINTILWTIIRMIIYFVAIAGGILLAIFIPRKKYPPHEW